VIITVRQARLMTGHPGGHARAQLAWHSRWCAPRGGTTALLRDKRHYSTTDAPLAAPATRGRCARTAAPAPATPHLLPRPGVGPASAVRVPCRRARHPGEPIPWPSLTQVRAPP